MMRASWVSLLLISCLCGWARAAEPALHPAPERVVFRTTRGDLVFVLFPDIAPKTVTQFLKLVRLGVYDTTSIFRIEPNFLAQFTDARGRRTPLSPEQARALHPIPAEFSRIRHRWGMLTLAHRDGDPNSGESSFSIMLESAPHLDGKYTIFGQLDRGYDVLEAIRDAQTDSGHHPVERIEVEKAFVLANAAELSKLELRKAVYGPYRPIGESLPWRMLGVPIVALALALAGFILLIRNHKHRPASFCLIAVLAAAFYLIRILGPFMALSSSLGVLLFAFTLCLFRLMSLFERGISQ